MSASATAAARLQSPTTQGAPQQPLVVLIGRPNCGKSSLFNAVTGGTAHVGNFPGVTVDVLEADARLPGGAAVTLADLPGLYSMEAAVDDDTDEGVARKFVAQVVATGRPMLLVHVVDSTHLALHLRLTRELGRMKLPLLVVASQRDLLEKSGRSLDAPALEAALGLPVVSVSARASSARADVLGAIERALREHGESVVVSRASVPIDIDPQLITDRVVATATTSGAAGTTAAKASGLTTTERLDAALLHPLLGPLLFVGLMSALFAAVFLIADPATEVLDAIIAFARGTLEGVLGHNIVSSFLSDGILAGAGTVLAFLPQIVVLTVAMELLEASGYLSRGAFLVDRLLRVMGLSGRSFLPLLMSHACAVPAISATRIVRDPKERLTAILVLPLMTCSARIPTYALIVSTFFFKASVLIKAAIFVSLYFAGLAAGLVASLTLRRTVVRGKSLPLVLEMPAYRMPQPRVVARQAVRAATRFLRDVGTTIVIASAILWGVLTLPSPFQSAAADSATVPARSGATAIEVPAGVTTTPTAVPRELSRTPIERSVAATVGRALEPVTSPLGFDWRINVGLIGSFGARELMVGTLGIIFGIEDAGSDPSPLSARLRGAKRADGGPLYPASTGLALLAFFVVACQCLSTVAAIRRETRSYKWPAFVLAYTYAVAYAFAFVVHGIARAAGL